jgi:hypothetical protein
VKWSVYYRTPISWGYIDVVASSKEAAEAEALKKNPMIIYSKASEV